MKSQFDRVHRFHFQSFLCVYTVQGNKKTGGYTWYHTIDGQSAHCLQTDWQLIPNIFCQTNDKCFYIVDGDFANQFVGYYLVVVWRRSDQRSLFLWRDLTAIYMVDLSKMFKMEIYPYKLHHCIFVLHWARHRKIAKTQSNGYSRIAG